MFDYLEWRGELSFSQSEFNEIDALVFSILAYLDFTGFEGDNAVFFKDAVHVRNGKS